MTTVETAMPAPPAPIAADHAPIPRAPDDLLDTLNPFRMRDFAFIGVLSLFCLAGMAAYIHQLIVGLSATAMTDYFSWGVYIVNFVFFIGISMAGTLISALLRLTGVPWRHPITRLAEAITLFALIIAGPMIIMDMGRPDRFLHVFLYGRLQSPILWDVLSLTTYMTGSMLYLYLPMIPDMAILRDCGRPFSPWRKTLYRTLALGWRGTPEQHLALERGINVMSVVIIPVAVSIHTVTAWIFGMTLRPGWHSTIMGPDFVVGALYSGIAAVITAIILFRRGLGLQRYIQLVHLQRLGWLLFVFGLTYAYFVINEHLGDIYTNERTNRHLGELIFTGQYAVQFWSMVGIGLAAPLLLLALPTRKSFGGLLFASLLVNLGMWLKRYIIVVPTLASPMMPQWDKSTLIYVPTVVEWAITLGGFSAFILMYFLFARIFPIVSIWETQEDPASHVPESVDPVSPSVVR